MRVVIAGYGVEGKASYVYYSARGNEVVIADERSGIAAPDGIQTILGPDAFGSLDDFDLIVRSPGIGPQKLPYGGAVWSATNEFFKRCPAPIIGVTGTKGKGTTSSLVASILRAAGKNVHLVGNIGAPALEVIDQIQPNDIVVYELSSFQLWDLQASPHVAVVLMIEPDHLDVHASFEEYVQAKANIAAHQRDGDVLVYNQNNEWAQKIAEMSPAGIVISYPFELDELASHVRLPGAHNLENASAAVAVARQLGIDETAIARGLEEFGGLPHRLKFVREVSGVRYFDDSIATTPGSAVAALKAFDASKIIILGGSDKGADYGDLVKMCKIARARVIAVGETGARIEELCAEHGVVCERVEGGMLEVVQKAYEIATAGDVVILSPASASFDQYQSYSDRGEQFIAAVAALK